MAMPKKDVMFLENPLTFINLVDGNNYTIPISLSCICYLSLLAEEQLFISWMKIIYSKQCPKKSL